jgi:hypothetical protein
MVNYQKGIIYNIWHKDILFYTGSTTNYKRRQIGHKNDMKYQITPFYKALFELNIPFEDLRFEIYEEYSCNSKVELYKREGEIQRLLKPKYNMKIEGRTKEEYKMIKKENDKIYYEKNKEKISNQEKEHYKKNKEEILKKNKEYRNKEENKQNIKEKRKEKYERMKEDLNKKIECECGCIITNNSKLRHTKSKKHLDLISNQT